MNIVVNLLFISAWSFGVYMGLCVLEIDIRKVPYIQYFFGVSVLLYSLRKFDEELERLFRNLGKLIKR